MNPLSYFPRIVGMDKTTALGAIVQTDLGFELEMFLYLFGNLLFADVLGFCTTSRTFHLVTSEVLFSWPHLGQGIARTSPIRIATLLFSGSRSQYIQGSPSSVFATWPQS